MFTVNTNIELFNIRIKNFDVGLKIREEAVDDLLTILFRRYKFTVDSKFVEYIETK